jgi:hypothetical protein
VADYAPVQEAGRPPVSGTASGTITAGDILGVSGDGTVAKLAALASAAFIGVAATAAITAGRVSYYPRGPVHRSLADGTVTAGDLVGSTNTANRQVKTIGAPSLTFAGTYSATDAKTVVEAVENATRGVAGIALTTAADNNYVTWMQT